MSRVIYIKKLKCCRGQPCFRQVIVFFNVALRPWVNDEQYVSYMHLPTVSCIGGWGVGGGGVFTLVMGLCFICRTVSGISSPVTYM
jgi:hypothetical protein